MTPPEGHTPPSHARSRPTCDTRAISTDSLRKLRSTHLHATHGRSVAAPHACRAGRAGRAAYLSHGVTCMAVLAFLPPRRGVGHDGGTTGARRRLTNAPTPGQRRPYGHATGLGRYAECLHPAACAQGQGAGVGARGVAEPAPARPEPDGEVRPPARLGRLTHHPSPSGQRAQAPRSATKRDGRRSTTQRAALSAQRPSPPPPAAGTRDISPASRRVSSSPALQQAMLHSANFASTRLSFGDRRAMHGDRAPRAGPSLALPRLGGRPRATAGPAAEASASRTSTPTPQLGASIADLTVSHLAPRGEAEHKVVHMEHLLTDMSYAKSYEIEMEEKGLDLIVVQHYLRGKIPETYVQSRPPVGGSSKDSRLNLDDLGDLGLIFGWECTWWRNRCDTEMILTRV